MGKEKHQEGTFSHLRQKKRAEKKDILFSFLEHRLEGGSLKTNSRGKSNAQITQQKTEKMWKKERTEKTEKRGRGKNEYKGEDGRAK